MLAYSDADASFFLAGKLGSTIITEEEEQTIQKELTAALLLEQGIPVAVGSGKSALKYKLRATSHSVKLTSRTWKRTAQQLRNTATWVGDLGENSICKIKTDLRQLMGSWIVDADVAVEENEFDYIGEDTNFAPIDSSKPQPCVGLRTCQRHGGRTVN